MKREKTLTKKERKALKPQPAAPAGQHIHCIACGRHLDPAEFRSGAATWLVCQHRSRFASCRECVAQSTELLAEHDRSGRPVATANAWH